MGHHWRIYGVESGLQRPIPAGLLVRVNPITDANADCNNNNNGNPPDYLFAMCSDVVKRGVYVISEGVMLKLFLQFVASQTAKPFFCKGI
jgi:hypothetical protein